MDKNTKKRPKLSFFEEIDTQIGQIDAAWKAENADEAMIRSESLLRTLRNAADSPNSGSLDGLSLGMVLSEASRERRKQAAAWKAWSSTGKEGENT